MKKEPSRLAAVIAGAAIGAAAALTPMTTKHRVLQHRQATAMRALENAKRANPRIAQLERQRRLLLSTLVDPRNSRQLEELNSQVERATENDLRIRSAQRKVAAANQASGDFATKFWAAFGRLAATGAAVGGVVGFAGNALNRRRRLPKSR